MIHKPTNAGHIPNDDSVKEYTNTYVANTTLDAAAPFSDTDSLPSTTCTSKTRTKFSNADVEFITTE